MTLCRAHHFNSSGRCSVCSMQARFYSEGIATLQSWTKEEIEQDKKEFQDAVEMLMCNLHSHDENPLERLYDLEVGQ